MAINEEMQMKPIKQAITIKPCVINNDADKNGIYINESNLKQRIDPEGIIKPVVVLVLDSSGNITPIGLDGFKTTFFSDIDKLNQRLQAKTTKVTMSHIKFNDGLSIIGLGENSCRIVSCNGRSVLVCD